MKKLFFILALFGAVNAALALEPCRIEIVEKGSGWPVPLVELLFGSPQPSSSAATAAGPSSRWQEILVCMVRSRGCSVFFGRANYSRHVAKQLARKW